MTDFAPDHQLGEDVEKNAEFILVEADGAFTAGDFLEVTGVNADGVYTVQTQTSTNRAVAVAQYDAADGELSQAIFKGQTKVTFGADVTVGAVMSVSSNKAIDQAAAGNGLANGMIVSDGAADNDTGYVYFDGSET